MSLEQGIHEILDELYSSATDEHDKGSKFERLMQAYLQTTCSGRIGSATYGCGWSGPNDTASLTLASTASSQPRARAGSPSA